MRTTFLDPALDERLARDGYVVVPLVDAAGVERLAKAYAGLGVAPGDPQRACVDTFHCFDSAYKEAVHEEVQAVLGPAVQAIFDRHKALSYCYIQKWPGERSGFGLHQDLTLLDETKYRSVEVWCALTDTNEENGQLWVVPGSHLWAPDVVRGIHGFPAAWQGLEERVIARHAIPVPVKAGEAVIFCHSTCHFSFANGSDSYRLVAATDLIPDEAQHLHYVANADGGIDAFEIDESFWVEQNPFTMRRAPAHLTKIGEVDPSTFTRLTEEDLDRLVAEGLAVESDPVDAPPINPDLRWCHRCGTTEGVDGYVDQYNGNVTLLCDRCDAAQARMAGVVGDIDVELRSRLDLDGYVVVDLFDAADRERARELVDSLDVDPTLGFFTANRDAERADATRVDRALRALAQPAVDRVLPGYRVFKGVPVVKGATGDNPVALHQDWSYVDERYHRGYVIWAPLDGAGPDDGGMHVVPGSHRWLDAPRGSGFDEPFAAVADEIIARGSTSVPLAPGQAVIYDNALLHHTPPNRGAGPRQAVAVAVAPPQAPVVHLHATDDGRADVFEIPADDDFFTAKAFGSRPDGVPTRTVERTVAPVTLDDVERWLPAAEERPDRRPAASRSVGPTLDLGPAAPAPSVPATPTGPTAAPRHPLEVGRSVARRLRTLARR